MPAVLGTDSISRSTQVVSVDWTASAKVAFSPVKTASRLPCVICMLVVLRKVR